MGKHAYLIIAHNKFEQLKMLWIDWKRGNPYTFEDGDYEELIASDYLFARKFDTDQYPKICKALYKNCVKK